MRTLRFYLLRQVIATLAMTVLVCTLVLLLGSVLKELLPFLVSREAGFGFFAQAIGLLIPFVGAFALPIGLLVATLLVSGRFSADQELTAARASGVSLLSLVTPILLLSVALSGVSAVVNLHYAPRCRVAYKQLQSKITTAVAATFRLPEGRPIEDFPGYVLYVGKNDRQNLADVLLFQLAKDQTNIEMTVRAPYGKLELDYPNQKLALHLTNATIVYVTSGVVGISSEATFTLNLSSTDRSGGEPGISDMTFRELQAKLNSLERRLSLPKATRETPESRIAKARLIQQRDDVMEPIRVEIHQKVAFSFACFSFTLIGIPLGIRVHRRETNIGIAIAMGLVAVYYGLIILANSQSNRADLAPHLWMWIPNFLFQAVGAVLLWRANRGI